MISEVRLKAIEEFKTTRRLDYINNIHTGFTSKVIMKA